MNNNIIPDERDFQNHIVDYLVSNNPLYQERKSTDFDLEALCDRQDLLRFLRAQQNWAKLCRKFSNEQEALEAVIARYKERLKTESIIHLLNGIDEREFKIKGVKLKLVQYRPDLAPEDSEFVQLYKQNRFSVIKEFKYDPKGGDQDKNRIDLVFLINGLPIMTCELKNELSSTHWNYTHAIEQYKKDRDPNNIFLKTCLVHFAVDNSYAFMTTKLNGEKTRFLPFNRDVKNPPMKEDETYSSAYLWRDIWQADSLLNILEHFIKNYDETDEDGKNKKNVTVFPRFHQLRAVRNLVRWCKEKGAGNNYLIEHSAGSGKTKSMAWLAHQLANAIDKNGNAVYDSIIMVTDRIVLNANMADDVNNFCTVNGLVKDIRRGSKNLAKAIDEGGKIIVCTVQKFGYALADLKREKKRKYAVIVDEAHTAIGAESAKDLVKALSSDPEVQAVLAEQEADCEDVTDAMLAYMQATRQHMKHISFFAFTATPKDRTYALFGCPKNEYVLDVPQNDHSGYVAHDLYSMRQAIDEKFILDVLQNYVTYQTMFEYNEKELKKELDSKVMVRNEEGEYVKEKDSEVFEKKKAVRLILEHIGKEPKVIHDKAEFVVTHFMENICSKKINGQAKSMVVCDSRESVVLFKHAIDEIIEERYNGAVKSLGAFSGQVTFKDDETKYTEEILNGTGLKDNGIREAFKKTEYRFLIVADKFQTGFDQPLLHTMYVDKSLGNIQAIQTLSRLNRIYPDKEDTLVIDFRNHYENIKKAFDTYHYGSSLEGSFKPENLYSYVTEIRNFKGYSQQNVNEVVDCLIKDKKPGKAISIAMQIVAENLKDWEEAKLDKYRRIVNRYIRAYGFLAQLMDFIDPDLEKEYWFLKVLYGYLPYTPDSLPMDILSRINLDRLDVFNKKFEGTIEMEQGEALKPRYDGVGKKPEDEDATLKEILDIVNEPSAGYFDEHEAVIKPITLGITTDTEVIDAFKADNNYNDLVSLLKDKVLDRVGDASNELLDFLANVLSKDSEIGKQYINGLYNYLAGITRDEQCVELDLTKLKERIKDDMEGEFAPIAKFIRPLQEVIDFLIMVIEKETLPKMDGSNDLILDSLNMVYCNDNLRLVDRRRHYNSLVSKYETFLKKVYYIIEGKEITNKEGSSSGATFTDALFSFSCLRGLRNNNDDRYASFKNYIELVRQWRNDEAHLSPDATEDELKLATHILITMYVFVISQVTGELDR